MLQILIQGRKEFGDSLDISEGLERLMLLPQVTEEETTLAWTLTVLFHARFPTLV